MLKRIRSNHEPYAEPYRSPSLTRFHRERLAVLSQSFSCQDRKEEISLDDLLRHYAIIILSAFRHGEGDACPKLWRSPWIRSGTRETKRLRGQYRTRVEPIDQFLNPIGVRRDRQTEDANSTTPITIIARTIPRTTVPIYAFGRDLFHDGT